MAFYGYTEEYLTNSYFYKWRWFLTFATISGTTENTLACLCLLKFLVTKKYCVIHVLRVYRCSQDWMNTSLRAKNWESYSKFLFANNYKASFGFWVQSHMLKAASGNTDINVNIGNETFQFPEGYGFQRIKEVCHITSPIFLPVSPTDGLSRMPGWHWLWQQKH